MCERRLTVQIRNNFVLFVKNTMGHRFVDLGRLDEFMDVAFHPNKFRQVRKFR
jgi:hypothetical protein